MCRLPFFVSWKAELEVRKGLVAELRVKPERFFQERVNIEERYYTS